MRTEVLDQLGDGIDTLADLDVDSLTDAELDELVIGLQRMRHRLAGLAAVCVGSLGRPWGVVVGRVASAATRLARDGGTSLTTAHVELRRPPMDHVDLLGRADQDHRHDLFARDEEMLVEQCATCVTPKP